MLPTLHVRYRRPDLSDENLTYNHWRPTTAIREATTPGDGNALTDGDTGWTARAQSVGGTPQHWSGHSTFSMASAEVLRAFFCTDVFTFSVTTASAPGGVGRTYSTFSEAAAEAGVSRVHGGFHFNFSNVPALAVGRAIAEEVLNKALLLKHGPTHFGQCPL